MYEDSFDPGVWGPEFHSIPFNSVQFRSIPFSRAIILSRAEDHCICLCIVLKRYSANKAFTHACSLRYLLRCLLPRSAALSYVS